MDGNESRVAALRFCLGIPITPVDGDDEVLLRGYFRGFLRPIAKLLGAAVDAARRLTVGYGRSDLFACLRWRLHDAWRVGGGGPQGERGSKAWLTRRQWMRRRCLHDAWKNSWWSRRCFAAWRCYVAARGPAAWRRSCLGVPLAARRQSVDAVRDEWETGGDGVRALEAWQRQRAWWRWLEWLAREGEGSHSGQWWDLWLDTWSGSESTRAAVGAQAVQWLAKLTTRARAKRAKEASEVKAWLDGVVRRVEREVVRGMRIYGQLLGGLVRAADRAEASRKRKAAGAAGSGKAAEARAARLDRAAHGEAPLRGTQWAASILYVQRTAGGGRRVLVRWAGQHSDQWRTYAQLNKPMQRAVCKWQRGVFDGSKATPRVCSPRWSSQPTRVQPARRGVEAATRQAAARFKRLVRARDRGSTKPSLVDQPSMFFARLPEEDGRGRLGKRVILDELGDMDLRGEQWREEVAARGRAPKRRRH